jgi:hypothetical protein
MANIYNMADTWNAGGTTFTAIKMDVTDTASAAASLLMDLKVGGSTKYKVAKTGQITFSHGIFSPQVAMWESYSTAINLASVSQLSWSSGVPAIGSCDTGIARLAAAALKVTDGSTGGGWLQQGGGNKQLSANATNATTTMSNLTGLSVTLIAGRKYSGKLIVYAANSLAADGIKLDFDGGTATMTSFRAHGTIYDTALLLSSQTSAIATDFAVATVTGDAKIEVAISFVCNAAGTFIPRFAGNTAVSGTVTAYLGSYIILDDMP